MERLVLEGHPENPAQSPSQDFPVVNFVIQSKKPSPNSISEVENLAQNRPFFVLFRNSRMIVNLGRIVHVRVDTSLKDVLEVLWLRVFSLERPGKVNVEEGRNMP